MALVRLIAYVHGLGTVGDYISTSLAHAKKLIAKGWAVHAQGAGTHTAPKSPIVHRTTEVEAEPEPEPIAEEIVEDLSKLTNAELKARGAVGGNKAELIASLE